MNREEDPEDPMAEAFEVWRSALITRTTAYYLGDETGLAFAAFSAGWKKAEERDLAAVEAVLRDKDLALHLCCWQYACNACREIATRIKGKSLTGSEKEEGR